MAKWQIDTDHAFAEFKVKHLGIAWVTGHMFGIEGIIDYEPGAEVAASFDGSVDVNTLTTGQPMRDGHLKSDDFFDVANHPKLHFVSKEVKLINDKQAEVFGDLTIRGNTKRVSIKTTFLGTTEKTANDGSIKQVSAFTLETEVDRRDFGLDWNVELPNGNLLVGNNVEIRVDIEAIKQE